MSIEITDRQRELLYEFVTDRLTGIDSVWRLYGDKDWEKAKHCGRKYADFLLLLDEGLGWEPERSGSATLSVPPSVLGRVLEALKLDVSVEDGELHELRLLAARAELKREETVNACDELKERIES